MQPHEKQGIRSPRLGPKRWPMVGEPVPGEVFGDEPFDRGWVNPIRERARGNSYVPNTDTCATLDEWRKKAGHLLGPAMGGKP